MVLAAVLVALSVLVLSGILATQRLWKSKKVWSVIFLLTVACYCTALWHLEDDINHLPRTTSTSQGR